jgi:heavy metal translocating P-type ATPase
LIRNSNNIEEMRDRPNASARITRETYIAGFALFAIAVHLSLKYGTHLPRLTAILPLYLALVIGGVPLVLDLGKKLMRREFGSDLLAGISILTACLLGEFLVATIVVLMLSGGAALESNATARASSVLDALARRVPSNAHRREGSGLSDIPLEEIRIGDILIVYPHEICPVDGAVLEGQGIMDEAYLTGEPYEISKTPGAQVISGAINGASALVIQAEKLAVNSRYARIMQVVRATEEQRPQLRRIADQLGAWYTPLALAIASAAALASGDARRFLAVVVIATPCPLLLAIPTAIIGAISLSARRAIIIRNPGVLEQIDTCQTLIFDKTGTLTYGRPSLTSIICAAGFERRDILQWVGSIEQYSKHPLAGAILAAAKSEKVALVPVARISERPGEGLQGVTEGRNIQITGRKKVSEKQLPLPPVTTGLECLVFVDDKYAAALTFHDAPRHESRSFIQHLAPRHGVRKIMLVSGDRESEVRYLAESVGISEVHAGKSPEEKVAIVKGETSKARTLFVGDGINDAPALLAATVGIAFGSANDIATEAADAVVLEPALGKVDELMHIGRRLRRVALQCALGGMTASILGMAAAAAGYLPPITGAIGQEIIDLFAVLNAVRVALPAGDLQDF